MSPAPYFYSRGPCALTECFFFQAEDGIRDLTVTGVQTCALPICLEILRHHAVELEDLRPAGIGEAATLVELLPSQLHQVLVDDVADVLEVADERDQDRKSVV